MTALKVSFTASEGNCGRMVRGTLTSDGRVKGDCPKVEWPLAKTGNPALRCSAKSLHRPEMTTPIAPRALAPAVINPPHTAFFVSGGNTMGQSIITGCIKRCSDSVSTYQCKKGRPLNGAGRR